MVAGPAGAPTAAVAGVWRPRGGCPLPWSGIGAGGEASGDAGAEPASAGGLKVERAAQIGKEIIFQFVF
jgi:hypothetical protein